MCGLKISIPAPWNVIAISERVGISIAKSFKAMYLDGISGGVDFKPNNLVGEWIFSGITRTVGPLLHMQFVHRQ